LWISKGIVTIHGGSIGVECEEGSKGSMFYAELPLVDSSPDHHSRSDVRKDDENDASKNDPEPRVWRWSDPRNNIDHTSVITPTSRSRILYTKAVPIHAAVRRDSEASRKDPVTFFSNNFVFPSTSVGMIDSSHGQQVPSSHELTPSLAPAPPLSRPSLRILIVDDAKSIRKILDRSLTAQGHTCHVACDGQECLDLVIKESKSTLTDDPPVCFYDLILMDSEMPVMSGPEATKLIRSMGFTRLIILGVTGNVLPEDVSMFFDHGVDAVVGKPMNLETMWKEYDRIARERLPSQIMLDEQFV
jgi:CheY-like chemotaxis protein